MLNTPAPFPEAGSYAVLVGHKTELVRIIRFNRITGQATIVVLGRAGASANMTLPIGALQDGTELTMAEHAELDGLARHFHSRRRIRTAGQKAKKARHDELRLRRIYSRVMNDMLRQADLLRIAA